MCIYCNTKNYRKIYENHYGPILKEPNGRSYEVHHIDGNHNNNDPSNLTLLTLQQHYDVHYAQGDYASCALMIIQRMNYSPAEISKMASELTGQWSRERIQAGTHNFLGDKNPSKILAAQGKHHWQNSDIQRKTALTALKNNKHPTQISWSCLVCKKTGKGLSNYSRYHGANCKVLKPRISMPKLQCIHCGIKCAKQVLLRWHGDNCRIFKKDK